MKQQETTVLEGTLFKEHNAQGQKVYTEQVGERS